jgi:hypothetical protein
MVNLVLEPVILIGAIIMICLFFLQCYHHLLLADLRNSLHQICKKEGEEFFGSGEYKKHYSIPRGCLFNYVSNPHYLCEILMYVCYLIICEAGYMLL